MTCAPRITGRNLRPARGRRHRFPTEGPGTCRSMADEPSSHLPGLTVAITGATGNVGTALLRRLSALPNGVNEIRGLARRQPPEVAPYRDVRWHLADLGEAASEQVLARFLDGADAVVHLAWALQPGRHPEQLRRVNVDGTRRVMRAATAAGVAHVVHMSSIGAYAPGAVGHRVSEDWPTTGIPSSPYSRDKSQAERVVREVTARRPGTTVTVVRPTLVLQPEAASEIGRYFLGPLLLGRARPPLPRPPALRRRPPAAGPGGPAPPAAPATSRRVVRALRRRRRCPRAHPGSPRRGTVQPRRRAGAGQRRARPRTGQPAGPDPGRGPPGGGAGGVHGAARPDRAGLAGHGDPPSRARHRPGAHPSGLGADLPRRRGAQAVRGCVRRGAGRPRPAAAPGRGRVPRPGGRSGERTRTGRRLTAQLGRQRTQ